MGPIWRPSFGPRGTDVQIRTLAWLLCIASRLTNSVLSSIMRPYTPHTLADVGIDTLQYAVEWKERSLGQTLRPRLYRARHTSM